MQRKPFAALLQRVRRTVARYDMLTHGDRILVALSGGADSVGLLAALTALAGEFGIGVCAAHLNHGLRGEESQHDQSCAQAVARRLGVDCSVGRSDALPAGPNLEARARAERYAFLARVAAEQRCTKVATGHTLEDQAETVLLRLLRGTGANGLIGIRGVRDGRIIRPLLECSRTDVRAAVCALELPWCEDSSNRDRRFLRNRVRHEVMPLLEAINPAVQRRLAAAAQLVADELDFLGRHTAELLADSLASDGALRVAAVRATAAAGRTALLRAWLREQRGHVRGLGVTHFRAIAELVQAARPNGEVALPHGHRVVREYDRLLFCSGEPVTHPETGRLLLPGSTVRLRSGWRIETELRPVTAGMWKPPADLFEVVADAATIAGPLLVRTLRPGDRVQALGLGGHRKLQDVLVDGKVPRRLRRTCPVVELDGEVFWVPGVVRSNRALVTPNTRSAVHLTALKPTIAGQ